MRHQHSNALCRPAWVITAMAVILLGQTGQSSAAGAPHREVDRRITLYLPHVPLSDLCWVLTRRTGLAHEVADEATGDLTATVAGTLTVGELHRALAAVLGVSWKRAGDARNPRYVVSRTPAGTAEETRLLQEHDRIFATALTQLIAAASRPDDEFAKLPSSLRAQLGPAQGRALMQILGGLSGSDRERLLAGLPVTESLAALPIECQRSVRALGEAYNRRLAAMRARDDAAVRSSLERPMDLSTGSDWLVHIGTGSRFTTSSGVQLRLALSRADGEPGGMGFGLPSIPCSPFAAGDSRGWRIPIPDASGEQEKCDPGLTRPWSPGGVRWEQLVRSLESIQKRPVVSDAYLDPEYLVGPSAAAFSAQDGETLAAYLDRMCRTYWKRRWARVGPAIVFQRTDWPTLHRAQIPESKLRRWKDHIIANSRVPLADLTEMAALSPYQIEGLTGLVPGLAERVYRNQDLLLFWKDLPQPQRQMAERGELTLRDVPLALHGRARRLVSTALGSEAPLVLSNAKLRVEQSPDAFALHVHSLDKTTGVRQVDLTCSRPLIQALQRERQARLDVLEAAASPSQSDTLGGG